METLRNQGFNFPVSSLTALIVTIMLLIFNFNLSKIYIPVKIKDHSKPVQVDYPKPPEPIEIAEASALITATMGRIFPPFNKIASITSGTPCPFASGAKK